MNVLIVENGLRDLQSSRKPLGQFLEGRGHSIFYACPNENGDSGVMHIPMSRNSFSMSQLIRGVRLLLKAEEDNDIDTVITFRLLPNVLNVLASVFGRRRSRIGVITGLGVAFIQENGKSMFHLKRKMIEVFYRFAQHRIQLVAQNPDDLWDLGVKNGKVIFGSGVNAIERSGKELIPIAGLRLLFVGRLLKSKGILDTVEIFRKLKERYGDVRLTIAGDIDLANPDSLSDAEYEDLKATEDIDCLGFVDNIERVYAESNILLFPSRYREGVPRAIIEALQHGLTIITYDLPGCRETISDNGLLMPTEGAGALAVNYLASLSLEDRNANSLNSKNLFKKKFSADIIYPQILELVTKNCG